VTSAQNLEAPTLEAFSQRDNGTSARASWWSQGLVVFGLCWTCDAINNLAGLRRQRAFGDAQSILRFEQHPLGA